LGGTPTVRQFDLVAIELPLLSTFNAVALVRSHVGLLKSAAPRQGVGSKLPPGIEVHVDAQALFGPNILPSGRLSSDIWDIWSVTSTK
jgi:hypothetical protein